MLRSSHNNMSDSQPLITHIFTADPSAHVFDDKLYVYPSHDRVTDIEPNCHGDQYDMDDYHVFSMDEIGGPVTDHGIALKKEDVPWVSKQLWAPDIASKNGKYYFYFPAKDKKGIFRVGVATGERPEGPFRPEEEPMKGSFSIDPASFVDDNGDAYLYFGGLLGGQLQCWVEGSFLQQDCIAAEAQDGHALTAKVAKLSDDMLSFQTDVKDIVILDETGAPLKARDHDRRFFEAAWMHKYNGSYYFSYSTGNTHLVCYAIGSSPWGPFKYVGRILEPLLGWTTHHSIVEFRDKWYLFYHDSSLSKGVSHLRCVKVREIVYDAEGKIRLAGL